MTLAGAAALAAVAALPSTALAPRRSRDRQRPGRERPPRLRQLPLARGRQRAGQAGRLGHRLHLDCGDIQYDENAAALKVSATEVGGNIVHGNKEDQCQAL